MQSPNIRIRLIAKILTKKSANKNCFTRKFYKRQFNRQQTRAIKHLIELSKVAACNDRVLDLVLFSFYGIKWTTTKRAHKILYYFVRKATKDCEQYIDKKFEQLLKERKAKKTAELDISKIDLNQIPAYKGSKFRYKYHAFANIRWLMPISRKSF